MDKKVTGHSVIIANFFFFFFNYSQILQRHVDYRCAHFNLLLTTLTRPSIGY